MKLTTVEGSLPVRLPNGQVVIGYFESRANGSFSIRLDFEDRLLFHGYNDYEASSNPLHDDLAAQVVGGIELNFRTKEEVNARPN